MGKHHITNGPNSGAVDVAGLLGLEWTPKQNCWWLVCEFYRRRGGEEVGEIAGDFRQMREVLAAAGNPDNYRLWTPAPAPAYGDVLGMTHAKKHAIITHVGIYVGGHQILHTLQGSGSQVTAHRNLALMGLKPLGYWRLNDGYDSSGEQPAQP